MAAKTTSGARRTRLHRPWRSASSRTRRIGAGEPTHKRTDRLHSVPGRVSRSPAVSVSVGARVHPGSTRSNLQLDAVAPVIPRLSPLRRASLRTPAPGYPGSVHSIQFAHRADTPAACGRSACAAAMRHPLVRSSWHMQAACGNPVSRARCTTSASVRLRARGITARAARRVRALQGVWLRFPRRDLA